jgi:hypothetical protein
MQGKVPEGLRRVARDGRMPFEAQNEPTVPVFGVMGLSCKSLRISD